MLTYEAKIHRHPDLMLTYEAKLTCDSAPVCSGVITSRPVSGAFEATIAVIKEAKDRGWKFTKHQTLCPDCAGEKRK